jgi:hypothetical protein
MSVEKKERIYRIVERIPTKTLSPPTITSPLPPNLLVKRTVAPAVMMIPDLLKEMYLLLR